MDARLCAVFARAVERHRHEFNEQGLQGTLWAFGLVNQMMPSLGDPIATLDSNHAKRESYQTLMQYLAITGQVVTGFALLLRARVVGLLSHTHTDCYPLVRTLLEACRGISDSDGASRLEAAAEHLGLIALVPAVSVVGPVAAHRSSDSSAPSSFREWQTDEMGR
eukprot:gnl/TRDRNA2_/TRDRNA2_173323_c22_seq4.p1 gnl/TRDRNA2_/TRDRNA2_173323_c22~~gnl/TRDRNA2_/TRDRNA2_173323_c22_seq4.p1  ORF type:complete len:165 (-),score=16.88 gnl/TRDRNA2_/TRDRNA2_173323_c22_seq4:137-631(-)